MQWLNILDYCCLAQQFEVTDDAVVDPLIGAEIDVVGGSSHSLFHLLGGIDVFGIGVEDDLQHHIRVYRQGSVYLIIDPL